MNYPGSNNAGWDFNGISDADQSIASSYRTFASSQHRVRSRQGSAASSPENNIRSPTMPSLSSALAQMNASSAVGSGSSSRTVSSLSHHRRFENSGRSNPGRNVSDDSYTIINEDTGRYEGHGREHLSRYSTMNSVYRQVPGRAPPGDDSDDSDTIVIDESTGMFGNATSPCEPMQVAAGSPMSGNPGLRPPHSGDVGSQLGFRSSLAPHPWQLPQAQGREPSTNVQPLPSATPEAQEFQEEGNESQSVAYWPDLRPRLADEAAIRDLQLECPICTDIAEDMRILSCGHIICKECLYRLLRNRDGVRGNPRGRGRECPYCRIQLGKKRGCAVDCPQDRSWTVGIQVPGSMADLARFPLTMPEGGGKPWACTKCREDRVMHALKQLCRELLNDSHARVESIGQGQIYDQAGGNVDASATRATVPELQGMCDAVMDALYAPDFCAKYTGVLAPPLRQQVTADIANRPR